MTTDHSKPRAHEAPPKSAAILVAAGDSTRMGLIAGRRKPLADLEGLTVIEHVCRAFAAARGVEEIVIVAHRDDLDALAALVESSQHTTIVSAVVAGGATRTDSVGRGVEASSADVELVAIHDGARPLIQSATIERALVTAGEHGAALVAVPATDTIKRSLDGMSVAQTLERSALWFAQTPQVFRRAAFLELLQRASKDGLAPTDDAALHEHYIGPVALVPGDATNLKLTTPTDLEIARAILRARSAQRTM